MQCLPALLAKLLHGGTAFHNTFTILLCYSRPPFMQNNSLAEAKELDSTSGLLDDGMLTHGQLHAPRARRYGSHICLAGANHGASQQVHQALAPIGAPCLKRLLHRAVPCPAWHGSAGNQRLTSALHALHLHLQCANEDFRLACACGATGLGRLLHRSAYTLVMVPCSRSTSQSV